MSISAYYSQLPSQMPQKIGQSFLGSVALSTFCGATPPLALAAGGVAALATLVEAVARPHIQQIFEGNNVFSRACSIGIVFFTRDCVALATQGLVGVTYYASSNLLSFIMWFGLNYYEGTPFDDRRAFVQIFV